MQAGFETRAVRFAGGAGVATALLGLAVLAGWLFDVALLRSAAPGLATTKANTALAFVLAGLALAGGARAAVLGLVAALLGAATLAQDLFGVSLAIDELLVRDAHHQGEPGAPGRMAPATALCFVLGGVAAALLAAPGRALAAQSLALAMLVIALVALVGYAYDVRALYEVRPYATMSLYTVLGLVVLGAGLLAARPRRGWVRSLSSPGPGGFMLRQAFLPALAVLFALGWLRVVAEARGLFDTGFAAALMVIVTALLFAALAWRCARELDAAARRVELMANAVPSIVWTSDTSGRVTSVNARWQQITGTPPQRALGREWIELVHPEDRSRTVRELDSARTQRSGFVLQHRMRAADGGYRVMVLAGKPWLDADGRFRGHLGSSTDVTSLDEARRTVGNLARRLLEVEENERRALSRELHDRVGQNLSALNLNLQLIRRELSQSSAERVSERIEDVQQLLRDTTGQVRDVMTELRPPGLDDYGLATALRNYAEHISERFPASLAVRGEDPRPRLPADTGIAFFRIAQEALTNAAKHARARRVEIRVESGAAGLRLTIADDGAGFDPQRDGGAAMGLGIMRERAEAVGARLRVESRPGAGTRVIAEAAA